MPKKLITPTESCARYLKLVVARGLEAKGRSDESIRHAKQCLRRGDYDEAIRLLAQAREQRALYYAAASIEGSWRLPEPTHYIAPDERGGLPQQGTKEDRPVCGTKKRRAVTCIAAQTTCPDCVKVLLKRIDKLARHHSGHEQSTPSHRTRDTA